MKNNSKNQFIILLSLLLVTNGCASIIKGGGPQAIQLKSVPTGANCQVYDNVTGNMLTTVTTPGTVSLNKSAGYFKYARYHINCALDNNLPQEAYLEGYANGWYIGGNILLGGLIGYLIVDPASGAMWTLEPETISVNFEDPSKSILRKVAKADNTAETSKK